MPSTFVATPDYPNVPDAPGVPPLNRLPTDGSIPDAVDPPLTADSPGVTSSPATQQWGIYDTTGAPILVGDTTFQMQYLREYKVSDYPVEQGAFASYNKVQLPFISRLTFLKGGSVNDKSTFLLSCATAVASLDLSVLATPEVSYPNVNVTHYDYDRKAAKGVGLMYVEVWLEEIRVAPAAAFTSTASPTGASPTHTGTVQAQTPNPAQAQAAAAGAS